VTSSPAQEYQVYGQPFTAAEMYVRAVALFNLGLGRLHVCLYSPMWLQRAGWRHEGRSHRWWCGQAKKQNRYERKP
jgi:hypothetical protein